MASQHPENRDGSNVGDRPHAGVDSRNNQGPGSSPGVPEAILTVVVAIVNLAVLLGIGAATGLIPLFRTGGEPTPTAWPDASPPPVPSTFTPTTSPTPKGAPPPTATLTPTPTPTFTPTPTPLPPPVWSELGQLTTIVFTHTIVVEEERTKVILGTERVLLVAVGSAHAGVDLTRVKDSDVRIKGTSLEVTLPHAEILTSAISLNDSHIYDTQRRWLLSEYEGLEKEALDSAERKLEEAVQRNEGMMRLAEEFARLRLTEFLRNLGFTEVTITFK